MAKKLTADKAKEILHDKSVHGHPLTDKQRKFFGAIAGGAPVKAQNGKSKKKDSLLEDIVEVIDPTGISSWDDIYRSYQKSGMEGDTPIEILGALPLLGKVGKIAKANKSLAKTSRQAKSIKNFINATKIAGLVGRASDAAQLLGGYEPNEILPEYKPNSFETSGSGPKYKTDRKSTRLNSSHT